MTQFTIISSISFLLSFILSVNSQTKTCDKDRSCAGRSFGSNYTHLSCEGFQSCSNLSSTTASVRVDCTGSQSCSYITRPYLNVGTLSCEGYESCKNSNIQTDFGIYCWGQKSCLYNDITFYNDHNSNDMLSQNSIECRGVLSCALSNITLTLFTDEITGYIEATGMFSLYNTIVDSTESSLNLELNGHYSGLNSTILCGYDEGYQCSITCKGTGCYYTKVFCFDNNLCDISCNETNGDICPLNITYFGLNDTVIDIDVYDEDSYEVEYTDNHGVTVDITKYTSITSKENICLNASEIQAANKGYFQMCNDYKGCYNSTYINNNNKSVCCQGDTACSLSSITTPTKTYLNSQNQFKEVIRCDGVQSCQLTTIIANNSVDCGGYHSCQSAQLDTADITRCSGYYSCLSASIADARTLFCNGHYSCYSASISGIANLYGFGYRAFDGATIRSSQTGAVMNIYMCSYLSGYDAEICCYSQDSCNVYCGSDDACKGVKISDGLGCGNINNITFHYNTTIAAETCQVYLPRAIEPILNNTNTSNLTMISTTPGISETGMTSGTSLINTEVSSTFGWNDSYWNESGNGGGGNSPNGEPTKKPKNNNENSETGLTTAVIIIASLVVAAVVGLGVFYCVKSRKNKGKGEEHYNKLLDMDKSEL